MPWDIIFKIVFELLKTVLGIRADWSNYTKEEKEAKRKHLEGFIVTVKTLSEKNAQDVIDNEDDFIQSLEMAKKLRYLKYKEFIFSALSNDVDVKTIGNMGIGEKIRAVPAIEDVLQDKSKSNNQKAIDISKLILS